MGNWWGSKLGNPGPAAPRELPYTRPAPVRGPGPVYPPQPVGSPMQEAPQGLTEPYDPSRFHEQIWQWGGSMRGGAGETARTGNCPNCGSPRYFSRAGAWPVTTATGVVQPGPECFECGYPRIQGALSGAQPTGAVHQARQGAGVEPTGTLASLRGR